MKPELSLPSKKDLLLVILAAASFGIPLGAQIAQKYSHITFAHGLYYFGPEDKVIDAALTPTPLPTSSVKNQQTPVSSWETAKGIEKDGWLTITGQIFPYLISVPRDLPAKRYPQDPSDSIGIETATKSAYQNLLLHIETLSSYDKKYTGKPRDFANDYWRFFSGLNGIKQIKEIIGKDGQKGYLGLYNIAGTGEYTTDVFFPIPKDNDHLIHLMRGGLAKDTFEKIVQKFEFKNE